MKDIIRLNGLSFYAYHGLTTAEKETGRIFEVDCELEVDLAEAGKTDQITDTIDYVEVFNLIRDTVEGTAFSLLEGLAQKLAMKILDSFEVYRVTLKIRKMSPPIAGQIKNIEVEITRFQGDASKLLKNENDGQL